MKNKIEYILKHNEFILTLYKVIMSRLFQFIGLFIKIDENMVLFSAHGRRYNDSPKVIYEYLLNHHEYEHLNFVWVFDQPEEIDIPKGKKIKTDTLSYFFHALKAKYWITSVNIERGLKFKKKKTIYLNTWHGISLNVVGNDLGIRNDYDWSYVNYVCYSGEFEKEIMKRAFNCNDNNMIPTGLPRNDSLYNFSDEEVIKIKKKLDIPLNKKVILYAPTWRDSIDGGKSYTLTPPINWTKWEEQLKDDYIVLLRTHVYTTKLMNVEFNSFVRPATNYPEVNDLLKIADILISDYSCIQYDYSILGKPMICFGYDWEEYSKSRPFYIDMVNEFPNGVIKHEDEVINLIKNMNYNEQCEISKQFSKKHIEYGGKATQSCVNYLFNKSGETL